jgi:hypothetical protein
MKLMQTVLIPVFALIALASPTFAQTDLTPVANQVIDWLAVALMAGGGVLIAAVLRWVSSKTKLQDNEFEALLASRLNDILHRAIEHAVVVAKNEVNKPGSGLKDVKLDNFFLNVALNFAISRMPEIIDYFKLDEESIRQMILARINSLIGDVPIEGGADATETAIDAKVALSPAA